MRSTPTKAAKRPSIGCIWPRAYRYANKPEDSEKLLTAILKESPDHVEAGQLLAEVYYTAERWKDLEGLLEPLLRFRRQ